MTHQTGSRAILRYDKHKLTFKVAVHVAIRKQKREVEMVPESFEDNVTVVYD